MSFDSQTTGDSVTPRRERVHSDNYVLNELKRLFVDATDAFGRQFTVGTSNPVDIPSFYAFNEERLRLFLNDARSSPSDAGAKFTDREGNYLLSPADGDTMEMHTAERPRYIVGYDALASTAAKQEATLGSGDTHTIGIRDRADPENLAFFEINGGSDNRLVITGEGTERASETFTFPEGADPENPIRYEIQFNWYGVGRFQFEISYTDSSEPAGNRQQNALLGELVVDDQFTTGDAAFHVFQELEATNSGKEVAVGSFGYTVVGNVTETLRTKGARLTGLSYGGSGDYEALAAFRIDPPRGNVSTQFAGINVFPDGGSGQLLIIVVPTAETDASGFGTPPEHNADESVIEQTTSVTQFPDQSGTTVTSASDPGGYQVGFSTFEASGTVANTRLGGLRLEERRPLYEDDVAIALYQADTATSRSVNVSYLTEQQY